MFLAQDYAIQSPCDATDKSLILFPRIGLSVRFCPNSEWTPWCNTLTSTSCTAGWFVGLTLDEAVWDHSNFSANRDRLLNEHISRLFFDRVLCFAEWQNLVSDEHFSVDGTLIEAWASMKSFVRKDGTSAPPEDGSRNPTVDFKGESRSNETHQSSTDPDARLYKKSQGDKAQLCYIGHALIENRAGLVVDALVTHATGTAEREAAQQMAGRTIRRPGATLGADRGYDVPEFVEAVRDGGVTPHVAQKTRGSAF